ncbi:MAG: phosphate signaling complex protein PhoU [Lachnospiraceae bacterium]
MTTIIRQRFEKQLKELNDDLILMGKNMEQAIGMATDALVKQDVKIAKQVMEFDDVIDQLERDIESLCMKLLLCQQPVARDLRFVSAALKMITDMERIGDHAFDIGNLTTFMADKPYAIDIGNLQKMSEETMKMVMQAVEAFTSRDEELAQEVIDHDEVVDDLFVEFKANIIREIRENTQDVGEQAADLLMVSKYFERIGDHAVNIAEWVNFAVNGER